MNSMSGLFVLTCACALASVATPLMEASAQRQPAKDGIHACALLTQAELETILGGKERFPTPPQEDALPSGTWDCNFSAAGIQVDPFAWATLESDAKKDPTFTRLTGVGDAGYLSVNTKNERVVVYARAGQHTVTVTIEIGRAFPTDTADKARTAAIALTQALIAKLR